MSYQLAQKVHAACAQHNPPDYVNYRARDVVDIILIKELVTYSGSPTFEEMRAAIEDIYLSRGIEAKNAGRIPHTLPPTIVAYPHWANDYAAAANAIGLDMRMEEAVAAANEWIGCILGNG